MNVLQMLPKLDVGGVETGTVDLARYLSLHAHKAVVISNGGSLVKKLDQVGARHYQLPVHSKNPFVIMLMIIKVCDIIKKENIDVVHGRSRVPALIGFFASKFTMRTFITTAHGQYKKHIMSFVMGWGKSVIVASTVMARYMIETFKVRPDKIRIIPRGVDPVKFKFKKPSSRRGSIFRIGLLGRMTPLKGHEDFIRAISVVSRSVVNLKVYIVGKADKKKKDYYHEIQLLIKRLGLENIIELLEYTDDVPKLLSNLDVLVSASRQQEAFGRTIIEAQSSGIPVVATKVGGVIDIVRHNITGLLCSPMDSKDMAAKILEYYHDIDLCDSVAEHAHKDILTHFTLTKMMASTVDVYEQTRQRQRILVIKTSALGDIILCTPSLRAIREKFPHAVIKVLVSIDHKNILRNCPYIDELIVCDFKYRDKSFKGLMRLAGILKEEDFDIVVDLQNNKKSHLLSFLSCATERFGYDNGKFSFLINRKVRDSKLPVNPIDHQMRVLKLLGIHRMEKTPDIYCSAEELIWATDFLKEHWIKASAPFVCMNLEASPRWQSKRWPVEYFLHVADRLARELSVRVVLIGVDPKDISNVIFMKRSKAKPVSAVGKTTVGQLTALVEKCSLVISGDSAPIHIAAGVQTPFIGLFGPTSEKRHVAPVKDCKIIASNTSCRPCYKPKCKKGYLCMHEIDPDIVFESSRKLLKKSLGEKR